MRKTDILICGAYGLGNIGDEAILSAILREMEEIAPGAAITVLSRSPRETAQRHHVQAIHSFDLFRVWKAMEEAKLYVNGGGTLIQNVTSRRSLHYYLHTLRWAKERGCKVLMYGCGIGPVRGERDVEMTRRYLDQYVDAITLREPDSMEELKKMGVTAPSIQLAADPALTLSPAPQEQVDALFTQAGIPADGKYICFALRKWRGFEDKAPLFGKAAQYAYETYGLTPIFAAVENRQDPEAARMAARDLSVPHYFLDDPGNVNNIIGALARMKVVVSMRLHALIFAAGQGVPLAGVVYDPKVSSFLSFIGQDIFMDLDSLTEDGLCSLIDSAVKRMEDSQRLKQGVAHLRKAEQLNRDCAARLLRLCGRNNP